MATQPFDQEEQEFLKAAGLDKDDLEWLVADATAVPDTVAERVLQIAQCHAAPATAAPQSRRRSRLRGWVAAAVAVVGLGLVGSAAVAMSPGAQPAIKGLIRMIPGVGATAVQPGSLTLAKTVTAPNGPSTLTVSVLLADSGQTQVRLQETGATVAGMAIMHEPNPHLELVLPDGKHLASMGVSFGISDNGVVCLWGVFQGLPAGTRSVQLNVPPMFGIPTPVSATLPLKEAATADTQGIVESTQVADVANVQLTAPFLAIDGDRIRLTVQPKPQDSQALVKLAFTPAANFSLTDDLGNSYKYLWQESVMPDPNKPNPGIDPDGGRFTAVFEGPVKPGTKLLRFKLEAMAVMEQGAVQVGLPTADLAVGQTAPVDKTVNVGRFPLTLKAVTRVKADLTEVKVEVPATEPKLHALSVEAGPQDLAGPASLGADLRQGTITIEGALTPGKNITLILNQPTVTLKGPWQLEIPAP